MSNLSIIGNNSLTMSSREIADLVDSRHDKVKQSVERLADKGVIGLPPLGEYLDALGRPAKQYVFSGEQGKRDSIVVVAQLSPEFTARLVDRWQELEAQQAPTVALPNFSNPAEAARAWAAEYEARLIAEKTKAEIGSRREATAMNTASQAVKHANNLEIQLDRSKQYATVKRMEMLYHGQKFNWRLLKAAATEMQIPPIDVFGQNYGKVNAYHADVWREVYALSIDGREIA